MLFFFLSFFFSSQGFFIFLLHTLRNADVRAEFKRKKRMWFQMRGRVADLHSSDKWTSKAIRSDAFEFNEKHVISSSHLSSRNKNQIVPFQEPLPSVECNWHVINRWSEGAWLVLIGDVAVEKLAGSAENVLSETNGVRSLYPADEPLAAILQVIRPCAWIWSG